MESTNEATNLQFVPEEILHEKQSLQLCAVHAVNNLLQASPLPCHAETAPKDDSSYYVLCAGHVYRCNQKMERCACKKEFDEIADELHQKEMDLFSQDPKRGSWSRLMMINNHRSLVTGNYSFEAS